MKAIGVRPGHRNRAALLELPMPSLDEVPDGQGVLVRVLEIGVDGTDREISAGEYGKAPQGSEYLILGHESLGRVEAVGSNVRQITAGDYVVAIVRRPGTSRYDVVGMPDMTTDEEYLELGINLCHGFLTEYYVDCQDYVVRIPNGLRPVGVLTEPASIVAKGLA
ncbi:MAG: alcohol dehydrogenase catalytic domain-containing protein [Chloroflexi bacterium]|nr:alcohol dehydrogenase catalytic domain-containing protein [Chloroflexota bacterium]